MGVRSAWHLKQCEPDTAVGGDGFRLGQKGHWGEPAQRDEALKTAIGRRDETY